MVRFRLRVEILCDQALYQVQLAWMVRHAVFHHHSDGDRNHGIGSSFEIAVERLLLEKPAVKKGFESNR